MKNINLRLGDGTVVHGSVVVADSIQNSFNTADQALISNDLKELLKELSKAVANMSASLPEETAKQVARDLESFTAEAASEAPRKKTWKSSIGELKGAAAKLGEIGKPVLELAAQIATILLAK